MVGNEERSWRVGLALRVCVVRIDGHPYNTGHRERYLADSSQPPLWRSRKSRHQRVNT